MNTRNHKKYELIWIRNKGSAPEIRMVAHFLRDQKSTHSQVPGMKKKDNPKKHVAAQNGRREATKNHTPTHK